MERQQVDHRAQSPCLARQGVGVGVGIVGACNDHVLEGDALTERLRRLEHLLQGVLLFDGHQGSPLVMLGGVERDGESELLRPPGQRFHTRQDPDGRNGDMTRPDAEPFGVVEDGEHGVDSRPVEQRLPHAHEDDIGRLVRGIA